MLRFSVSKNSKRIERTLMRSDAMRQMLLEAGKKADAQISAIYAAQPLTFPLLRECLTDYVLAKFLLTREESADYSFQKLADFSLAKSMKISVELVHEFDIAKSCTGTSSAMVKKALLYNSVQTKLNIELPAEKTPYIQNFGEFADLVWESMRRSEFWRDRMAPKKEEYCGI